MNRAVFDLRMLEMNTRPVDECGDCVIYWMQRSQRGFDNPALTFAIGLANDLAKPLLVYFGLFDSYPMASARAFLFMIQGLREVAQAMDECGIGFVMRREAPNGWSCTCGKRVSSVRGGR